MELTKAKILLDKINRLYRSMSLDEDNVAPIERDLMRDYIKQLYATFLIEESEVNRVKVKQGNAAPKATYAPPPVQKKVVAETPPPPPPPPPPVPVVEEIAPAVQEDEPAPAAEKTIVTKPNPITFQPAVAKPKTVRKAPPPPSVDISPDHEELFAEEHKRGEISERLSQTPIKDISMGIGLNEKIYFVNELFGADNTLFRNVVKDLNAMPSFEAAKSYLSTNFAGKYDWTNIKKRTMAKKFIKIVRRRYV